MPTGQAKTCRNPDRVKRVQSSDLRECLIHRTSSQRCLSKQDNTAFCLVHKDGRPEIVSMKSDHGVTSECPYTGVKSRWECASCTFVNQNIDFLQCEICGELREKDGTTTPGPNRHRVLHDLKVANKEQAERLDCLRRRTLQNDRIDEITRLQARILDDIIHGKRMQDEDDDVTRSPRSSAARFCDDSIRSRAKLVDAYIAETDGTLEEERKEQEKAEVVLQSQRRGLTRENGMRDVLIHVRNKRRHQRKLLRDWQAQSHERDIQMLSIRKFQDQIWDTVVSKSSK